MAKRSNSDAAAVRRTLQQERTGLLEMSAAAADQRRPVELDQQSVGRLSRMDALQGQAMAQAQEVRRHARLQQIDAALERLDAGEYGYCVACGDDIPAKRLAIDPAVARCISCAD